MTQIACDLYPLCGFTLTDAPPQPVPPAPTPPIPGKGIYFLVFTKRSKAEILDLHFSTRKAAERWADMLRTDTDVMAIEVHRLVSEETPNPTSPSAGRPTS